MFLPHSLRLLHLSCKSLLSCIKPPRTSALPALVHTSQARAPLRPFQASRLCTLTYQHIYSVEIYGLTSHHPSSCMLII